MLILTNSIFFRVPKTGSLWAQTALKNANLFQRYYGSPHNGVMSIESNKKLIQKFKMGFIRNPITWYISRWCSEPARNRFLRNSRGKSRSINTINLDYLHQAEVDNFSLWIERVADTFHGFPSGLFQEILGDNCEGVDFLGRTEKLPHDLILGLEKAGEVFDPKLIINTEESHVADPKLKSKAKFPKHILQNLIHQNGIFMDHHGYSTDIKDYEKYIKN